MINLFLRLQYWLKRVQVLDFFAPLAMRLYLAPVMWMAGTKKLSAIESTIAWFGNPEWGLGLPFPEPLAWLVAILETTGAIMLLCGFGVRLIVIPLMLIMLTAALTVHWDNGWLAIAEADGFFATDRTRDAIIRLDMAKSIVQEYGNYGWLTGKGSLVILNNGVEFAVTYFIMLLSLFFSGAGRYLSIDYWVSRWFTASGHRQIQ
ncbi:MAG TPA: DoxX family protein [Crenotrichaceae bacterium]|nr:DoxX family protein [Crenotrichaceae bacterium]